MGQLVIFLVGILSFMIGLLVGSKIGINYYHEYLKRNNHISEANQESR